MIDPEAQDDAIEETVARASGEPSWPKLDGYEIVDVLGSGGMGVVYRARDSRRGVTVAVKTMKHADAVSIYRFKQEFRALLDVSHPNLVTLHELISDGRDWFIVMEFIDGETFLDAIRHAGPTAGPVDEFSTRWPETADAPSSTEEDLAGFADVLESHPRDASLGPEGLTRLREGMGQLAEGLTALHQAGKLHRDIKPSNVMVTRHGRVVLMDFGLIIAEEKEDDDASTEGNVVGTIAYMSPEQASGQRLSAASDWYSVGVMLYEALTGRRPFTGRALEILMNKQRRDPPPPMNLVPGIPEDLNALCVDLLRRDPAARPSGEAVMSRLGLVDTSPKEHHDPPSSITEETPFVGRIAQRAALEEALGVIASGRAVVVFLSGPSGVGKSALVQTFLDGPAKDAGAIALSGRCHERESVPYKALDSVIDALSRHLRRLPPRDAEVMLPRDVSVLARVFPVLRSIAAVVAAPRKSIDVADPQELRRRAYNALRELFARLGDRRPVVVAIDDLQWGDADSLAVLSEVLRSPDPPVMLLVASYRSEEVETSPFLRALMEWKASTDVHCRVLDLDPLSADESKVLAKTLLGGKNAHLFETVARESGGNPLFVAELARSAQSGEVTPNSVAITLDEVLWARVLALPEDARHLLEIVAVSGGKLRIDIAWKCLGRDGDERAVVAMLRSGRLVRGAGASDEERIETYHDRVREAIVAHLPSRDLRECHRRLALALEAANDADPEALGVHFREAGDVEHARSYFARAAGQAAEALAFDRATVLYRRALDPPPSARDEARKLRACLADALANAGRGAEAAREYLASCEGATVAETLELRRKAAMQFLISGHMDEGLDTLRDVLKAIGMTLPQSPKGALASLLWSRARLRMRGLRFHPRDPSEISDAERTRIDVCWSAGLGLSNVDWIRGADFQARGLLLALKAGDPSRIARALSVEAAQNATIGLSAHNRTTRLLDRARGLASSSSQPYPMGMLTLAEGVSSYLESRWLPALESCDRAEGILRDRCTGVAWELDTAHAYALWALSHLGRWSELSRRVPMLLNEARERGDLYASMNLSTYVRSIMGIASDEAEAARQESLRVMSQWSKHGYHVQHNDQVWALVQIDLYLGNGQAAWERITHHWPTLTRSLLMRVQFIRVAMIGLRARCALSAVNAKNGLYDLAQKDASRLDREKLPWASAQAMMIRAGVAKLQGHAEEIPLHLSQASAAFAACDMALCAAVAEMRLGQVIGGAEGTAKLEQSRDFMKAQSIVNPDRVADLFAPGFK